MNEPLKAVKMSGEFTKTTTSPSKPPTRTHKDVIHPSELQGNKGNSVEAPGVSGNGNEIVAKGSENTQMVVADQNTTPTSWTENPYVPTHPTLLREPEEKALFLEKLKVEKYIIRAAHAYGCSRRTVQRRMVEDPVFAVAVDEIIRVREEMLLSKIEEVSESEALKTGRNSDRSKQLDALAPSKYKRDSKGVQVDTNVTIVLGFNPPKHKGT